MIKEMRETMNKVIGYSVETRVEDLIEDNKNLNKVLYLHEDNIQTIHSQINRMTRELDVQQYIIAEIGEIVNIRTERIDMICDCLQELNNTIERHESMLQIHETILQDHEKRITALETHNSEYQKKMRKLMKMNEKNTKKKKLLTF